MVRYFAGGCINRQMDRHVYVGASESKQTTVIWL